MAAYWNRSAQRSISAKIAELDIDANFVVRTTDASLQNIAHLQFAADLRCAQSATTVGISRVPRYHDHIGNARKIGRDIVGDGIRQILLITVIAEIREREHDDGKVPHRDVRAQFGDRQRRPVGDEGVGDR